MATWLAHIQRHTSTIDTDELVLLNEIIAEAVNDCVEKTNLDLLYKYSGEPEEVSAEGIDVRNKKILMVLRRTNDRQQDAGLGFKYVPCTEKRFIEFTLFSNPKSLHYATTESPVYYIENASNPLVAGDSSSGTLKIFPPPDSGDSDDAGAVLYSYAYLDTVDYDTETSALTTMPPVLTEWVALVAAEKALHFKLSEMIHTEEDSELSALIQQQIGSIRAEIEKVVPQYMEKDLMRRRIGGGQE